MNPCLTNILPAHLLSQVPESARSMRISGVTSDSRAVGPGTIFVAVRGTAQDGHRFIREAVRRGAALVVGSASYRPTQDELGGVPYLGVGTDLERPPGSQANEVSGAPGDDAKPVECSPGSQANEVSGAPGDDAKPVECSPGSQANEVSGAPGDDAKPVECSPGSQANEVSGAPGVYNERLALARIASAFHGHPSRSLKMIGVTGTSGKTTTTYLIESILKAAGETVGLIGTVAFRSPVRQYPSTHTTPGPVELQKLLAEMKADGCTAVVMEVSSHALKQHRTAGIAFDGVVFTNLSPEHLDFHPDMEDYFRSKAMLFLNYAEWARSEARKVPVAALNQDDPYGRRILELLRSASGLHRTVIGFGLAPEAAFSGAGLRLERTGISGVVSGIRVEAGLIGAFNAQNLLGAMAVCSALGVPGDAMARGIQAASAPPGRLEKVPNERGIHVLVDYAHKPGALETVLATLAPLKAGHRLITVFGCGGDRDRVKRPVMGEIAARLSDRVWVTSDNPRTEDPEGIIREIIAGTSGAENVSVEVDRKKAIFAAISKAIPGDLVLIAGKGHEDYQLLPDPAAPGGVRKIHFDDREVASEALRTLQYI